MKNLLAISLVLFFSQATMAQDEKKIYTREEFKKEFSGKTEEEIIKVLGKAERISSRKLNNTQVCKVLEYDGIVKDKNAKEVDEVTLIWLYSNFPKESPPTAFKFSSEKKHR